jgi:3-dehydroquinate synthase
VVQADEKESGQRAMLNFGHTIGHVLEAGSGYRRSHGECVALGMLVACRLAELSGISGDAPRQRLMDLLRQWRLPVQTPRSLPWSRVWAMLQRDKKSLHGTPRFVLTPQIGRVEIGHVMAPEAIREALQVIRPGRSVQ